MSGPKDIHPDRLLPENILAAVDRRIRQLMSLNLKRVVNATGIVAEHSEGVQGK